VAVTPLISTPVAVGGATSTVSYQVTNTGNGFNTVRQSVAIDGNGNDNHDPGVDPVITNGAASQALAPDATIRVFLIVAAPASASDNQTSQVRLTATSVTGSGKPGTLFAAKGIGGVDAVVGPSGGSAQALEALVANLTNVIDHDRAGYRFRVA